MRWTGQWNGIVVSEALSDPTLVNRLRVTDARIETAPEGLRHRYWVSADPDQVDLIGRHLKPGPCCAHFWQGSRLLVLFHDARFDVSRYDRDTWAALRTFAGARGLPIDPLELPTGPPPRPDIPAPAARPAGEDGAGGGGGPASGPEREAAPASEPAADADAEAESPAHLRAVVLVDDEVDELFESVTAELLAPLTETSAAAEVRSADAALRRLRAALDVPIDAREASTAAAARGGSAPAVAAATSGHPRVFAPNGRWEHAGLRLAALAAADLEALRGLLLSLSAGLLDEGPPRHPVTRLSRPRARMGALARLLAVLDLPPDHDTRQLSRALDPESRPADSPDVVLTHDQERSFQRFAHRVTMLLTESDPLHRFLLTPDS